MSNVSTHPKAYVLNQAFESVRARTDLRTALTWTRLPNQLLDGRTPVQAIKDGDEELVLRIANAP